MTISKYLIRPFGGYGCNNRSEALRDLLRDELDRRRLQLGNAAFCVAILECIQGIAACVCIASQAL
jgi:metal-responsive CopG/Arc/MetJ family transcriptional regulator